MLGTPMKTFSLILLLLGAFALGMWVERVMHPNEPIEASPLSITTHSLLPIPEKAAAASEPNQTREEIRDDVSERSLTQLLDLSDKEDQLHRAIDHFSPNGIRHLLDELRTVEKDDPRARPLKRALYSQWAHIEPIKALKKVLQEKDARLQGHITHTAFSELAEQDLGLATSAFSQLQTRRQPSQISWMPMGPSDTMNSSTIIGLNAIP